MDTNIGIIGGADGPTQIYVTSGLRWYEIAAIALAVIILVLIIIRTIKKHKRHM